MVPVKLYVIAVPFPNYSDVLDEGRLEESVTGMGKAIRIAVSSSLTLADQRVIEAPTAGMGPGAPHSIDVGAPSVGAA